MSANLENPFEGPRLWLVATPIGNLEDISPRAMRVLSEADVIACEDTRTTRRLLDGVGVTAKRLIACHDHNEAQSAAGIVKLISEGASVALVSDAGMPGKWISHRLLRDGFLDILVPRAGIKRRSISHPLCGDSGPAGSHDCGVGGNIAFRGVQSGAARKPDPRLGGIQGHDAGASSFFLGAAHERGSPRTNRDRHHVIEDG